MIVADQNGVFSRVLTDFGPKHTVVDKNGEDIEDVMIRSIEPVTAKNKEGKADGTVQRAKINLPQDKTHNFEDGDKVTLSEVFGMEREQSQAKPQPKNKKNKKGKQTSAPADDTGNGNSTSVNGETFTIVEVVNTGCFIIDCDTTQYSKHDRDGIVTQQKAQIETTFKPLKEVLGDLTGQAFDQDLQYMDFEKMSNFKNASMCYKLFGNKFDEQDILNS